MPYSLLYFDERNERYQCIQDQTRKSIRGILGNTSRYFI